MGAAGAGAPGTAARLSGLRGRPALPAGSRTLADVTDGELNASKGLMYTKGNK